MKKLLIIGAALGIGSFLLIVTLYNTTDIPLIDEIVESTAKSLNVMPAMITKKVERKVIEEKEIEKRKIIEEVAEMKKEEITSPSRDSAMMMLKEASKIQAKKFEEERTRMMAEVKKSNPKEQVVVADTAFNALVIKRPEPPKEEVLFNVVKTKSKKNKVAEEKPKQIFLAKVHNTQTVTNDSQVYLRLVAATIIGEREFPENYVFEGKVNLFDQRVIVNVNKIGDQNIVSKNIDKSSKEGMILSPQHFQRGNIVLSDGEPLTFNF